jgi:hypothetical protein
MLAPLLDPIKQWSERLGTNAEYRSFTTRRKIIDGSCQLLNLEEQAVSRISHSCSIPRLSICPAQFTFVRATRELRICTDSPRQQARVHVLVHPGTDRRKRPAARARARDQQPGGHPGRGDRCHDQATDHHWDTMHQNHPARLKGQQMAHHRRAFRCPGARATASPEPAWMAAHCALVPLGLTHHCAAGRMIEGWERWP